MEQNNQTQEYAHSNLPPQSEYVRYTPQGKIDVKDSIVAILSARPGLRGSDIAGLIYDKKEMPLSYSYVYKVLKTLSVETTEGQAPILCRSGNNYYLIGDALGHDMSMTMSAAQKLNESGVDLDTINFLASGLVMAGEAAIAGSLDQNYDPMSTSAASPVNGPTAEAWSPELPDDFNLDSIE